MFAVEVYAAVRRFVFVEGNSQREAAKVFGLSRDTIAKMCRFSLPPGYTRTKPVAKPKLGPLLPVIDRILAEDRIAPVKQRHTAKRIILVLGREMPLPADLFEPLDGEVALQNGNDDVLWLWGDAAVDDQQVAIEDPGIAHGFP